MPSCRTPAPRKRRLPTGGEYSYGSLQELLSLPYPHSPLLRNARLQGRAAFCGKRYLLCNSFRLDFPRVVTFNRTFIPGFLLPAALAGTLGLVALGAFVIRTHQEAARPQVLLQQIRAATFGTGLSHRPVCRGESALRIV